ncbi:acyltransferase family protein [Sporomusa aerivorans]|uniref:acyltransferase family protein n=1 Tax=Sporomusa aerivorans TaxID=204936 RepID=UPI00352B97E9
MTRNIQIDVLRGFAILLVMLVHTSQIVEGLTDSVMRLFSNGARGVQLFFIASAFTMFYSLEKRRMEKNCVINFFIRRFFRIAPLFYCAIIYYGIFGSVWNKATPEIGNIITSILFINGWFPSWINSLVPGGWSIAVEMTFYLFIPLLFKLLTTEKRILCFGLASVLISVVSKYLLSVHPLIEDVNLWSTFKFLWFFNQFPIFFLGFLLFWWVKNDTPIVRVILICVSIAIFCSLLRNKLYVNGCELLLFSYIVIKYPIRLTTIIAYIGKISFSAYITHFAVLSYLSTLSIDFASSLISFLVVYVLCVLLTVLLSIVTYYCIEKPMINLGNKIILGGVYMKRATCVENGM